MIETPASETLSLKWWNQPAHCNDKITHAGVFTYKTAARLQISLSGHE